VTALAAHKQTTLGLGGVHRRHLPHGRKGGWQTRRRRFHAGLAYALAAFFALCLAGSLAAGLYGVAAGFAPLLLFPYFARPLRGGVLRPRAPRQARGLQIALDPPEPRRGDELRVTVTSRRPLAGLQLGLIATCWMDRHTGRSTVPAPTRIYEHWTTGLSLEVPDGEPFSYEGRHLTTAWAVAIRLPSGHLKTMPLWVAP
jgi:hypothetical protein